MAEVQPDETNRYLRIARNYLSIDTNLSETGSVKPGTNYVNKNSDGVPSIASRTHITNSGINNPQGFCLLFNKNNPAAYIKTSIPSSEANQYDIIIKAHYRDILYVDTNFDTIIIRPKVDLRPDGNALTNTFRCFVSYIAFKNKTTGKIDHLFECEERNGNILYDAVTGETATLEGVSSLSTLRNKSDQKEWIIDEEINLSNEVCLGGSQFAATNKLKFRDKLSVSFKLKLNPSSFFTDFNYSELIHTILQTATTGNGFYISVYKNRSLVCGIKSTNASNKQETVTLTVAGVIPVDNKFHDYVFIADATNGIIKFYIDSTLVGSQEGNIYPYEESSYATTILSSRGDANKDQNWSLKDLSIFNIDLSDESAPYTLSDFANGVPIPVSLLSASLDKYTIWDVDNIDGQTVSADKKTITWSNSRGGENYYIASSTDKKLAVTPGSWIDWTFKIDAYISTSDGVVDYTGSNISGFLISRSPSTNVYPSGYDYYRLFEKWKYEVIDEATGITEYQSDYNTTPIVTYSLSNILRPVDAYQTSKPKIVKVRVKLIDGFWSTESSSFGYFELAPIVLSLVSEAKLTGTLELVDCYTEGCQASYNSITDERSSSQINSKWMDQTCNGDFLILKAGWGPRNPQFPCKQYGTWLANVGYRNNGNNTYVPRKVNP